MAETSKIMVKVQVNVVTPQGHKIVCREPSGMNGENIVLYSTAEKKNFF